MIDALERLRVLDRQMNDLAGRRRLYMRERGRIVGELIEEHGWKYAAKTLGVSKSRLYQMRGLYWQNSPRKSSSRPHRVWSWNDYEKMSETRNRQATRRES